MKNLAGLRHALLLIVLFSAISFQGCIKDNSTDDCKDKNLTATVEGSAFESCVITVVPYPNNMWIQAVKAGAETSIHLYVPKAVGTYTMGTDPKYIGQLLVGNPLSQVSYSTDSIHTGTINITKFDSVNKVMSGDFSYQAKQLYPAGTAVKTVTAGSFNDVKW